MTKAIVLRGRTAIVTGYPPGRRIEDEESPGGFTKAGVAERA
jgi:hypothetical protein